MAEESHPADAELHQAIEKEVQESSEGGKAGNMTKMKEEIVGKEYKKQGGEYKDDNGGDQDAEEEEAEEMEEGDVEQDDEDEEDDDDDGDNYSDSDAASGSDGDYKGGQGRKDDDDEEAEPGTKRKRPTRTSARSKKQKSNSGEAKEPIHGSKHDSKDEPAPQGSNERLPKEGQRISWKAMPGWVHGKVLEVVTEEKDVQGKHIKATEDDPRIAIEADSGKFCVHKPDNCYFEDE